MSPAAHITRSYTASGGSGTTYPWKVCGVDTKGDERALIAGARRYVRRAIAIGAGPPAGSDMRTIHAAEQQERSGRQRSKVIVMARIRSQETEVNVCAPTHARQPSGSRTTDRQSRNAPMSTADQ